MQDQTGQIITGTNVDEVKKLISQHDQMQEMLRELDMTDPEQWAILAVPTQGAFLCCSAQLPQIAYSLVSMLNGIREMAQGISPATEAQVHAAMLTAAEADD